MVATAAQLKLENPHHLPLDSTLQQLLQRYCAAYKRVILRAEHGGGYSGNRILEISPIRADGLAELPAILKIGPLNLIEREWRAYQTLIQLRLPNAVLLAGRPSFYDELGLGVLRYQLAGYGAMSPISLADYWGRPEVSVSQAVAVLERLLACMHSYWQPNRPVAAFLYQASYDHLLPVHLRLEEKQNADPDNVPLLRPGDPLTGFAVGDWVGLAGFILQKSNPTTRTLTLCEPADGFQDCRRYVRVKIDAEIGQTLPYEQQIGPLCGQLEATRASFWQCQLTGIIKQPLDAKRLHLALRDGALSLRNPLLVADEWLAYRQAVHVGSIHGDLNLENILIEPNSGHYNLIDFADARVDHCLHDLLRLETEIMTKLLPREIVAHNLVPSETLVGMLGGLAQTAPAPVHTEWGCPKSFQLIKLIRHQAAAYLAEPGQMAEYYNGLCLYLLGATKFKNLRRVKEAPLPVWLAFWGAALVDRLLQGDDLPPLVWQATDSAAPAVAPTGGGERLFLPHRYLAAAAPLPAGSHFPFGRNLDFVGRQTELRQLAEYLQTPGTAVFVQGMGGVGKSQLVTEFSHRYGRFFPGGVFWLSFADSADIGNEVAACGLSPLLPQHLNFAELSLEEQVRWVCQGWESPLPRLLIFDNCEESGPVRTLAAGAGGLPRDRNRPELVLARPPRPHHAPAP